MQIVEIGVDFITDTVMGAFDDKKVARRYVPFFVTLFFFILFNNWLGLLPIVGEGFQASDGAPLLRPFTGDLIGHLRHGRVDYGLGLRRFCQRVRRFGSSICATSLSVVLKTHCSS